MDLRFGKKQMKILESRFKKRYIILNEIKKYAEVLNGNGQLD